MMDKITDSIKIKKDMMELWKETFHDSSRYIGLVFDTYFTPDNVFVRYDENRLIAALLSIPYQFQILTKERKKRILRGMYLCGLATHPNYRKKGIMGSLMKEAEDEFRERGYDLTFLIPADIHLREYYGRMDYRDASYRRLEFLGEEDVAMDHHLNIYSVKDLFSNDNIELVRCLADWCTEKERDRKFPTLLHSEADMLTVMEENENAIFLTEETFDLKYPILAKVRSIVFPDISEDAEEQIRIVGLYTDEKVEEEDNGGKQWKKAKKTVIETLRQKYPGRRIVFFLPYSGEETNDGRVEAYAMVKLLNANENKKENENLIFEISLMLD